MEQEPNHITNAEDEATAARITAWVLGEASAFEAEQLEELCANDPTWRSYERKLRAFHRLVGDAEKAATGLDDEWKLPPEKRDDLLEKISKPSPLAKRKWKISREALVRAACITVFCTLAGAYLMNSLSSKAERVELMAEHSAVAKNASSREQEDLLKDQADLVSESRKKRDNFMKRAPFVIRNVHLPVGPESQPQVADESSGRLAASGKNTEGITMPSAPSQPHQNGFPSGNWAGVENQAKLGLENAPQSSLRGPDQFAQRQSGEAKIEVIREFQYQKEYEPPKATSDAASNFGAIFDTLQKSPSFQRSELKVKEVDESLTMNGRYSASNPADGYGDEVTRREVFAGTTTDRTRQEVDQLSNKMLRDVDKAREMAIPTEPENEILASEEPYSTFSLRVSDASFQLAYDAFRQGRRPQPQDIRVEDFTNAFDYGDPAPANGEAVACFSEQSAHPLYPQRNWLRLSMRVGSSGRSAAQPLHLTLVIDQSGSMEREDRHEVMKVAVRELGQLLTANDRISVIGFSRTPRLLGENIVGSELEKWQSLVLAAPNDGGTNLEQALTLSESIATRHKNATAQNRILLVTDGAANLGNADPAKLAARVQEMRQVGLCFDVVGIATGGENDQRLVELARHGNGRYQVLQNIDDAKERFAKQLAGAFRPAAENVKVQIRFNSERVAGYKLLGFEKDRLNTEDFRNDRVDAAEIATDEAGNALYQIKPLLDGRGDIGEASVRFRDPASGLMVERKWTIPWQPATPTFDQSTATMQLAGLAVLHAESLKQSPLGAMARPAEMSTVIETVRRHFSQQPNAAKLLEMVKQAP